jgi:hypothetical protein
MKSDRNRYDDAVSYLARKIDQSLATAVTEATRGREKEVGGKIALEGGKKWDTDEKKRDATRALLLCTIAFFGPPHCAGDISFLPFYMTYMSDVCKTKTEQQIMTEIRSYLTITSASLEHLAQAAETANHLNEPTPYPARLRTDVDLGKGPICYNGVFQWLFIAGFISRRWLGKHSSDIHAETIHRYLGDGAVVSVGNWGTIPRGNIWNIHKTTDRATCHWGISLGDGIAAGCNNTGQGQLKYRDGGTDAYGQFVFTDLCAILETTDKYAGANKKVNRTGDDEPEVKKDKTVKLPLGSHITVRSYSPLSGAAQRIYM